MVVLSGWARRGSAAAEAELMARAWGRPAVSVVRDSGARHTVDNAASIVSVARELGAEELVVVTSWWHRPRAAVLPDARRAPRASAPHGRRGVALVGRVLLREAACLVSLPIQLLVLRRSTRRDRRRG